jgi:CheY-like chemotaxis protein
MGGELQVASVPRQGSRFWFDLELPTVRTAVPVSESRMPVGVVGAKRKVLVVDDEEHGRSLLRELLAPLGLDVYEACDGEDAVRQAALLRPDAILMDIRMPRLDGLEATRQIRRFPDLMHTAIIAISAGAFEHDRRHCIEAGANEFIAKPFRQERLLSVLCTHLDLSLVYAQDELSSEPRPNPTPLAPDAEQLRTLLDLASRGDIKRLLQHVSQLEAQQLGYADFIDQLRVRAAGYQMKELRRWLRTFTAVANEDLAQ